MPEFTHVPAFEESKVADFLEPEFRRFQLLVAGSGISVLHRILTKDNEYKLKGDFPADRPACLRKLSRSVLFFHCGVVHFSLDNGIMKPLFLSLLFSVLSLRILFAQPATEVYVFELNSKGKSYELRKALNVSANPGQYDNQPSFSSDGKVLYYVSQDTAGQTDIFFYQLESGTKTNFSQTPTASEYSPTLTPDGRFISCIRVVGEEQLLWKFPLAGGKPVVVVPELVIGYHAWGNESTVVSFVLGEPQTLQVSNLISNTHKIVAENVGRSIHRIPGQNLISFLQNKSDQPALIKSLNPETGEISIIGGALSDSQNMAWTKNGEILMGQGHSLFIWSKNKPEWSKIAALDKQFGLKEITRLAVSPDGKKLAVVVSEQP